MEIFDMLVLGVEAGIALAGFAGIIATFQFGGAEELRRADAVGLSMILQWSFFAVAVCSLVMILIAMNQIQIQYLLEIVKNRMSANQKRPVIWENVANTAV